MDYKENIIDELNKLKQSSFFSSTSYEISALAKKIYAANSAKINLMSLKKTGLQGV